MSLLRESIRKHLLLEKRIAQMAEKMEVFFNFEFHKGSHATERESRPELADKGKELSGKYSYEYNQREISNSELKFFIENNLKTLIAENIINGNIVDGVPFVVKSLKWELAFPIFPKRESGTYWRMNIGTLFRESSDNPFRVGKDQFVITVE
jgi:hypothetical protein